MIKLARCYFNAIVSEKRAAMAAGESDLVLRSRERSWLSVQCIHSPSSTVPLLGIHPKEVIREMNKDVSTRISV
jgi:hypothetical protein